MSTSLEHLPPHKRDQVTAIAALIAAEVPAEMVILFGSYARGGWVEDFETGYFSDYDFLIVVREERLAKDSLLPADLVQRIDRIAGRVPVSVIVHDLKHLNKAIREGQYFFVDIVREGKVLYNAHHFMLAKPKALGQAERLALAKTHFRKWFESASGFFVIAGHCMVRELFPHAAFLLHQTAERYFHAALLVFTGYKPQTHDLKLLAERAAPLHPALAGALPRSEKEDERLFTLLRKAYIEARYTMNYRISVSDLEALRALALDLGARVREACAEQMAAMGGVEPQEIPPLPSIDDRGELPEEPPLQSPEALRAWMNARDSLSFDEGRRAGKAEGIAKGKAEGKAEALLSILHARGLAVSPDVEAKITRCTDPGVLDGWIRRAMNAASAEEAVDA
ncbi:MAG: HEPN domain-containing protein [Byssovorax sp.]